MIRHLRTFASVAVLFALYGMCSPAAASLVWYASAVVSGTGEGVVPQILNFPSDQLDTASGCVKWTVSGNDGFGGACPDAANTFLNDQDLAWSQTRTPSEGGATTPFNLAIVYNASEPGSNLDVRVDRMVLTFYNPANTDASDPNRYRSYSLPAPGVYNPDASSGSGGSGMVFGLDWDQASALALWVSDNNLAFATGVRMGLGAAVSDHQGHSYFYVGSIPNLVPVPEPFSFGLVAAGLLALGLLRRKRA